VIVRCSGGCEIFHKSFERSDAGQGLPIAARVRCVNEMFSLHLPMSAVRWANRSLDFRYSSNRLVRADELPACLIADARGDLLYHASAPCGRIGPRQRCETYVRVSNFVRNDGFVGKRGLRR
jgi:hypothetical protein